MIEAYVDYFNENKPVLREQFRKLIVAETYILYKDLVRTLVQFLSNGNDNYNPWGNPPSIELDPNRITEIDYGDYQGTLIYVIAEPWSQPSSYAVTKVSYGSCSGCDTLKSILEDTGNQEQQLDDLLILCLHIIQQMKLI
jgi:hypothetical protein